MSLAGFGHVFQDARLQDVGQGLLFKTIPPPVLALLKIVSYLDDRQRRAKDLNDLRRLMRRYEENSERLFSETVLEADLSDIEFAGAFLLGLDVRTLSTESDIKVVTAFLNSMMQSEEHGRRRALIADDWPTRDAIHFHEELVAFSKGFAIHAP
jgi:predicted nucleotidyltransferase